jgi:threonine/homoserine/homoserine lactone efflux protein
LKTLYLLQGITFGFAAAVQPGPFQAYLITKTLQNGWRRALPLVFVPLFTDLPIIALVVLVLQRIPDAGITVLRLVGGAYLLFLAYGSMRGALTSAFAEETAGATVSASFVRAVLVNFLNPNPYLFWALITGPILMAGWRLSPVNGIGMLAGFYLVMLLVMAAILLAFGWVGRWNPFVRRILIGLSALGLAAFGAYQLTVGAMALHAS